MTEQPAPQKKLDIKIIALTVICIILAASLVGIIAFTPSGPSADLQAQLQAKDSTIAALQAQLAQALANNQGGADQSTIRYYENKIAQLNQQIADLNASLTDTAYLEQLLALQVRGDLYGDSFQQGPGTTTILFDGGIGYGGYLHLYAEASSNTTYLWITCLFGGQYTWSQNLTIGNANTLYIPVLPGTLTVKIGNTETAATNFVNATLSYYY